jgi:hypothetical protein
MPGKRKRPFTSQPTKRSTSPAAEIASQIDIKLEAEPTLISKYVPASSDSYAWAGIRANERVVNALLLLKTYKTSTPVRRHQIRHRTLLHQGEALQPSRRRLRSM